MSVIATITNMEQQARQCAASARGEVVSMTGCETQIRNIIERIEQPMTVDQLKTLAELMLSGATMLRENAERSAEAFADLERCMGEQREILERFKDQTN